MILELKRKAIFNHKNFFTYSHCIFIWARSGILLSRIFFVLFPKNYTKMKLPKRFKKLGVIISRFVARENLVVDFLALGLLPNFRLPQLLFPNDFPKIDLC